MILDAGFEMTELIRTKKHMMSQKRGFVLQFFFQHLATFLVNSFSWHIVIKMAFSKDSEKIFTVG